MIEFTQMTEQHIPQVYQLEMRCFNLPWSLKSCNSELNNDKAYYIVALDEDIVVGFAGYWQVLDETEIMRVAVAPEYRRMGLAKDILSKLEEHWKEKGAMKSFLEVRESNEAAIALYKKFGYEQVFIRQSYYEDNNENAVIMTKKYKDN